MKKIITILLLIAPCFAFAQSILTGVVKDEQGNALDAVTVTLSRSGKNIGSAFADLGIFKIRAAGAGEYELSASLVGYSTIRKIINIPADTVLIIMHTDNKQLKEVMVSSSRPVIERKIDRVSFNVENSIIASGGSAWDALGKAPGVQVNANNDVTANKKGVKIYLDGKPIRLSGDDLSAYLHGLPSSTVAQIEIFSNPPAQFEAEGASVINIITKKVKKAGFNATVNGGYTQGVYSSYNAGTSFNYRKEDLNFYGSYGYSRRHNFMDHDVSINYGTSFWDGLNRTIYDTESHNYRFGADYQLTSGQVLGLLVTGNNRTGTMSSDNPTRITGQDRSVLDSTLRTSSNGGLGGHQYAYNLNYSLKLDSGRRSLNIDMDYSPYESYFNSYVDNSTTLSNGNQTGSKYHIYMPSLQHIDIYSGKADYAYRLGKKWNLISGIKYSNVQSRNDFDFYNNETGTPTLLPGNSTHFDYREKTSAAYTSASTTLGRWTIQAGLRAEHTDTRGFSITLYRVNTRSYFKLFPTLFAKYSLNDNNEFQLNYAYRIDRPSFSRLDPARRYTSPYNFYVGNPSLQPAFTQNVELSYTYLKEYNVTAYYTGTHDVVTNVNVQDNTSKIYFGTQANLGLSTIMGVRFSAPFHLTEWWDVNAELDGYQQHESAAYLDGRFDYRKLSYSAWINQSFTVDKSSGFKAELTGSFNGPGIQNIYQNRHNSALGAGFKMNILKGAGTLRLAANDIFNTNNYRIRVDYLDQHNSFFHRNETHTYTLSLAYRFGGNMAASRERKTASEEERKRAQ